MFMILTENRLSKLPIFSNENVGINDRTLIFSLYHNIFEQTQNARKFSVVIGNARPLFCRWNDAILRPTAQCGPPPQVEYKKRPWRQAPTFLIRLGEVQLCGSAVCSAGDSKKWYLCLVGYRCVVLSQQTVLSSPSFKNGLQVKWKIYRWLLWK